MLTKICVYCGKEFHNHPCQTAGSRTWITRKYCSVKCCNKVKRNGFYKKCLICKKRFRVVPSVNKFNRSEFCSKKCWLKQLSINSIGEKNREWKGNKVGYGGLHHWVIQHKGKACKCDFNLSHKAKKFVWANISGKYLRNLNDYISLCTSCHIAFDKKHHWGSYNSLFKKK